jgi:hypothetical protein
VKPEVKKVNDVKGQSNNMDVDPAKKKIAVAATKQPNISSFFKK